MKRNIILSFAFSSVAFTSAAFLSVAQANPELQQRLQTIREDLKNANQDLSCHSEADCIAIPTGARACGGPSSFEIASKLNASLKKLQTLAAETTELENQLNEKTDVDSICTVLVPPRMECMKNTCTKSIDSQENP